MGKLLKLVLAGAVVVMTVVPACAEYYRYTDASGQVCYVDDLAKVPKKYRKQARPVGEDDSTSTVPSPAASPRQSSPLQQRQQEVRRFNGTVELFVTDWCGYCRKAEAYLQSRGVPFVRHNIEKDPAAKRRYDELGGNGVPLILVGSHKLSGFSPESLEYYLNK